MYKLYIKKIVGKPLFSRCCLLLFVNKNLYYITPTCLLLLVAIMQVYT